MGIRAMVDNKTKRCEAGGEGILDWYVQDTAGKLVWLG